MSDDLGDDDSVSSYDSELEALEREELEEHGDFVVDDDEATDSDYEPSENSESSESYESEVDDNRKRKRKEEDDHKVLLTMQQIQKDLAEAREEMAKLRQEALESASLRRQNA